MIKPRRIGHATFETPDLDRAIDYYTQVNGLVVAERGKNQAYLVSKTGLLCVQLTAGAQTACTKIAFEVAPSDDFAGLSRELSAHGVKSEERSDSVPGIGKMLAFKDAKGTTIELFKEWSYL